MKKLLFLLFLSLITLNCSRANDDDQNTDTTPVLPIKITFNGETSTVKYDGSKIVSIVSDINAGNKMLFTYNQDIVTNIKSYDDNKLASEANYSYAGGQLVSASVIDNTSPMSYTTTLGFTYISNTSVKVVKKVSYNQTQYTLNLVYTLNNGFVSKYTGNGSGLENGQPVTYEESGTFTYSDKNAIFKNVTGFDKILTSGVIFYELFSNIKSNILTYKVETSFKHASGSGKIWTYYKNTTTYNNGNYPIKEVQKFYNLDDTPTSSSPNTSVYEYNK